MKTRQQKTEELQANARLLEKNKAFIFADFNKVDVSSIRNLKEELKKTNATFKVVKKRLLKISLEKHGINFNPIESDLQLGVIFIPGELTESAGVAYKFARDLIKAGKGFNFLGAYEKENNNFLDAEQFLVIAKLPSKDILLAQIIRGLSGSVRAFMYIVQELSKKGGAADASKKDEKDGDVKKSQTKENQEEIKQEASTQERKESTEDGPRLTEVKQEELKDK